MSDHLAEQRELRRSRHEPRIDALAVDKRPALKDVSNSFREDARLKNLDRGQVAVEAFGFGFFAKVGFGEAREQAADGSRCGLWRSRRIPARGRRLSVSVVGHVRCLSIVRCPRDP